MQNNPRVYLLSSIPSFAVVYRRVHVTDHAYFVLMLSIDGKIIYFLISKLEFMFYQFNLLISQKVASIWLGQSLVFQINLSVGQTGNLFYQ